MEECVNKMILSLSIFLGLRMENIFSQEFNQFSSELLITALKGLEEEKSRSNLIESAKNGSNGAQPVSGLTAFITSIGKRIFPSIISPLDGNHLKDCSFI